MTKSTREFDRWNTVMKSTWTFQVFKKYNEELNQMLWSNLGAVKSIFKTLKGTGATWSDLPSKYLTFDVPNGEEAFETLEDWAEYYNKFQNWINLNGLIAITSNFETYLATVVTLALESDPGLLFNSSKSIDGVILLKRGAKKSIHMKDIIISVTKGDWNSRTSAFKKLFGLLPMEFESSIGELEKIRNLRNKVGHAFGRDIEASRNHEVKNTQEIEKLSNSNLKKNQRKIWGVAKSIDKFLLKNHIGEYQAVAFYHRLYLELNKENHQSERAVKLKKELGKFGDISGKEFCKGLVKYYEGL